MCEIKPWSQLQNCSLAALGWECSLAALGWEGRVKNTGNIAWVPWLRCLQPRDCKTWLQTPQPRHPAECVFAFSFFCWIFPALICRFFKNYSQTTKQRHFKFPQISAGLDIGYSILPQLLGCHGCAVCSHVIFQTHCSYSLFTCLQTAQAWHPGYSPWLPCKQPQCSHATRRSVAMPPVARMWKS